MPATVTNANQFFAPLGPECIFAPLRAIRSEEMQTWFKESGKETEESEVTCAIR